MWTIASHCFQYFFFIKHNDFNGRMVNICVCVCECGCGRDFHIHIHFQSFSLSLVLVASHLPFYDIIQIIYSGTHGTWRTHTTHSHKHIILVYRTISGSKCCVPVGLILGHYAKCTAHVFVHIAEANEVGMPCVVYYFTCSASTDAYPARRFSAVWPIVRLPSHSLSLVSMGPLKIKNFHPFIHWENMETFAEENVINIQRDSLLLRMMSILLWECHTKLIRMTSFTFSTSSTAFYVHRPPHRIEKCFPQSFVLHILFDVALCGQVLRHFKNMHSIAICSTIAKYGANFIFSRASSFNYFMPGRLKWNPYGEMVKWMWLVLLLLMLLLLLLHIPVMEQCFTDTHLQYTHFPHAHILSTDTLYYAWGSHKLLWSFLG